MTFEKITRLLVYGQIAGVLLLVLWGVGLEDAIRSALGHGKIAQSVGAWVEAVLILFALIPLGFAWGVFAIIRRRFDAFACLGFLLSDLLLGLFFLVALQ